MESCHPTLQDSTLVPDDFDDEHHHQALAMEYYLGAYEVFLLGQDVYPEQDKRLEDHYCKDIYILLLDYYSVLIPMLSKEGSTHYRRT